jgi:2-isopropylmalate synthase
VGVDENIIAASWHALEEAVTYALLRAGHQPPHGGEQVPG